MAGRADCMRTQPDTGVRFQSSSYWIWLEETCASALGSENDQVSILILLDMAGRDLRNSCLSQFRNMFQSSSYWIWLEEICWGLGSICPSLVSILILLDMAGRDKPPHTNVSRNFGVSILILLDMAGRGCDLLRRRRKTFPFQSSSYWIRAGSQLSQPNLFTKEFQSSSYWIRAGRRKIFCLLLMHKFQSSSYWIRAGRILPRKCGFRRRVSILILLDTGWKDHLSVSVQKSGKFQSSSYWIRAGSFLRFHTACTYDVSILILLDTGWKPLCALF